MNKSIGQQIAEARRAKGWTLEEAAQRTNLKPSLLAHIEADEFDKLPSMSNARGFIRLYARELDLDGWSLLKQFNGTADLPVDMLELEPADLESIPVRSQKPKNTSQSLGLLLFIGVVLVALGIGAYKIYTISDFIKSSPPTLKSKDTVTANLQDDIPQATPHTQSTDTIPTAKPVNDAPIPVAKAVTDTPPIPVAKAIPKATPVTAERPPIPPAPAVQAPSAPVATPVTPAPTPPVATAVANTPIPPPVAAPTATPPDESSIPMAKPVIATPSTPTQPAMPVEAPKAQPVTPPETNSQSPPAAPTASAPVSTPVSSAVSTPPPTPPPAVKGLRLQLIADAGSSDQTRWVRVIAIRGGKEESIYADNLPPGRVFPTSPWIADAFIISMREASAVSIIQNGGSPQKYELPGFQRIKLPVR